MYGGEGRGGEGRGEEGKGHKKHAPCALRQLLSAETPSVRLILMFVPTLTHLAKMGICDEL